MIAVSIQRLVRRGLLLVSLILTAGCSDSMIVAPEAPAPAPAAVANVAAAPSADFWYSCTGIVCEFFTANVLVKSAHWSFGHDATGVSPHVHHTFPVAGRSFIVTLSAIDIDDQSHIVTRPVNILALAGSTARLNGKQVIQLSWAPAAGDVNIFRDGVLVKSLTALENQGSWTDLLDVKSLTVPFAYKVCETANPNCSEVISVAVALVDTPAVNRPIRRR